MDFAFDHSQTYGTNLSSRLCWNLNILYFCFEKRIDCYLKIKALILIEMRVMNPSDIKGFSNISFFTTFAQKIISENC